MTLKRDRSAVASPLLLSRRRLLAAGAALAVLRTLGSGAKAAAQDVTYFRIGGGAVGSKLYQLAGTVAAAITNPPGADNCDKNGPCGVPGVVGLAQTTSGSVENLQTLKDSGLESAIVQADLAAAARDGSDAFKTDGPFNELRALARLGGIAVQIAVPAASAIQSAADLKGKTVALGPEGSDAVETATPLLAAFGVTPKRSKFVFGDYPAIYADLAAGKVHAVVLVDSFPNADLDELARKTAIRLLAIDGPDVEKFRKTRPYLAISTIPDGTYTGQDKAVPTLEVPLLWVGGAKLDNHLAYALVKALGSTEQSTNAMVDFSEAALTAPLRLHPGAQTYFEERNASGGTN